MRRHVQPGHLREGAERQRRLRTAPACAGRSRRAVGTGHLRTLGRAGHSDGGGRARAGLSGHGRRRRVRQPGGLAVSGARHAGDARRSAPAVRPSGATQRDDQGAGHAGRRPRDCDADRRGHQRQRDPAVRGRGIRGGGRRLSGRVGNVGPDGRRPAPGGERRQLLRESDRYADRRPTRPRTQRRDGRRAACGTGTPARHRGDRQRQGRLRGLSLTHRLPALASPGGQRRAATTPAVGEHQHQEPGLFPDSVRGRTDRPGHGQHRARRDLRGVPQSGSRHAGADR